MLKFFSILIFVSYNVFFSFQKGNATLTADHTTAENSGGVTTADTDGNATEQDPGPGLDSTTNEGSEPSETELLKKPFILMRPRHNFALDLMKEVVPQELGLQLPTKFVGKNEKIFLSGGPGHLFRTPLCPDDPNSEVEPLLETLHEMMPASKNCLFVTKDDQETCVEKPRASFETITEEVNGKRKPIICGIDVEQQLIAVEFLNCGNEATLEYYAKKARENLENLKNKVELPIYPMQRYPMYEVCYDFKREQTLWTRHEVRTTELLAYKKYPYQFLDTININDLSTDQHATKLNTKFLEELKNFYAKTTQTTAQNLVPRGHMALPHWKMATSHMINTAPLLPKFIPLMKAIDDGIAKAYAYTLTEFGRKLKIYTKADTIISNRQKLITNLGLGSLTAKVPKIINGFQPSNVWYKFIQDEENNSGILIVLHNTQKDGVKEKECEPTEITCNFRSWTSDQTEILEETISYAYCCKTTLERIEELFSMKKQSLSTFRDPLDLQTMISMYYINTTGNDLLGNEQKFKEKSSSWPPQTDEQFETFFQRQS